MNESESSRPEKPGSEGLSGQEAYNVVSDTVTGANLRWSDNCLQAVVILITLVLGAVIGALVAPADRVLGAIAGGFIGLLVGLFGSGIFLMIYRAVRHSRGRHD